MYTVYTTISIRCILLSDVKATDAYVAAGEKLAVFYQQLLDSPGHAA